MKSQQRPQGAEGEEQRVEGPAPGNTREGSGEKHRSPPDENERERVWSRWDSDGFREEHASVGELENEYWIQEEHLFLASRRISEEQ